MGSFLSQLEKQGKPKNQIPELGISKLRENHGTFKSICDTFAISNSEFNQIFTGQKEKNLWQIFDKQNTQLIDALELFSGLILFANDNFDKKLRFLFDLFDFNELNSLSVIDLEFMIISCGNATYKLYSDQQDGIAEMNEEEVSQFLNQTFSEDQRTNISQLLKWCSKSKEVIRFFQIIQRELPVDRTRNQQQLLQQNKLGHSSFNSLRGNRRGYQQRQGYSQGGLEDEDEDSLIPIKPVQPGNKTKSIGQIINSKPYQQNLDWLSGLSKKLFQQSQGNMNTTSQRDVQCTINWVYGFRAHDVKKPLEYINTGPSNDSNGNSVEKILYFTANIVVIYFPRIQAQKHYLEHDKEVISLAVARNKRLVASGELGDLPSIHVWDSETLQNFGTISGVHQKGVHLLQFFGQDQLIASCGLRQFSAVLIYSVRDFTLVLSTFVDDLAIELLTVQNYIGSFATLDTSVWSGNNSFMSTSSGDSASYRSGVNASSGGSGDDGLSGLMNNFNIFISGQGGQGQPASGEGQQQQQNQGRGKQTKQQQQQQQQLQQQQQQHQPFISELLRSVEGEEEERSIVQDYENVFIVCTAYNILLFHFTRGHFETMSVFDNSGTSSNVSQNSRGEEPSMLMCATAFRINYKEPYLKAYSQEDDETIVIVAGFDDGIVQLWVYFNEINEKGNSGSGQGGGSGGQQQQQNPGEQTKQQKSGQGMKGEFRKTDEQKIGTGNSIVTIVTYKYGIIVGTSGSHLYLYDFLMKLDKPIRKIDLTSFNFKLFSYVITGILVTEEKLLVSTANGDIIEIAFNQKQEWTSNKFIQKMHPTRLNYISKLMGSLRALCLLERPENDDRILFVGGQNSSVYGFSLETHEIIDLWTIGGEQTITAMDCVNFDDGGTVFAIGCENGQLFLRIDWEESPRQYDCTKYIHDVKFSSDTFYLIVACDNSLVYLFQLQNNSYFQSAPKHLTLSSEIPLSIDFVDDNKSFLIGTHLKNQYKVELPEVKTKNLQLENEKLNCTIWNIRFPLEKDNYMNTTLPGIIGGDIKVLLAGGESGYIYFWRDVEQLESNCGGFLKGHASPVARLLMSKMQDLFFSVGAQDNTVIEWRVDFINDYNDFSKPFQEEKGLMLAQHQQQLQQQQEQKTMLKDEVLLRELAYSYVGKNNYISDMFKDSFVLFRGTNHKMLNQHLNQIIPPFDENQLKFRRPPPLSIGLDFVYGFESYDKRNTLHYGHTYFNDDSFNHAYNAMVDGGMFGNSGGVGQLNQQANTFGLVKQKKGISGGKLKRKKMRGFERKLEVIKRLSKHRILLQFQRREQIALAQQRGIGTGGSSGSRLQTSSYNIQHQECNRNFVYFVSRIAIVYNPTTHTQKFYEGHKSKITCMTMHPLKFIVATGEASQKPCIHIWNVVNVQACKVIPTYHKNGIVCLAFSSDSSLIVSVGLDYNFSIQVTNWKTEEIMAMRNSGQYQIFDISFHPENRYEFTTSGLQNLTIWQMSGRNLLRHHVINVAEQCKYGQNTCITCMTYLLYRVEHTAGSDILVGNNYGDLALITAGRYFPVKEKAHGKMINVLKVTQAFQSKIIVITAGEDEFIRFWDTTFNLINQIHLRQTKFYVHLPQAKTHAETKNLSAQSVDIYTCTKDKPKISKDRKKEMKRDEYIAEKLKLKTWPKILIGTRMGDIIEATFNLDVNMKEEKKQVAEEVYKLRFNARNQMADDGDEEEQSTDEEENKKLFSGLYGQNDKFSFDYYMYLRFHSSQNFSSTNKNVQDYIFNKKVYFSLHPHLPIMATIGEDQNMILFDTNENTLLLVKYLGNTPTAIKFSPDGSLLVIGFMNGDVILFDYKIDKNTYGKVGEKYELPQLNLTASLKDADTRTPVLNIEFSPKADFLAVSYDNGRSSSKEFEGGKQEKEGSFIRIYYNKAGTGRGKAANELQKKSYSRKLDIRCPSMYEQLRTDATSYGCAVYYMTFDVNQEHLLIYYQLIDNYLVRVNHDSQGRYVIYDIKNDQTAKNWDAIKSIQWSCFNFPNSLVCQYQYYQYLLLNADENQNNNNAMQMTGQNTVEPYMSVMYDLPPDFLICGSIKGDLHFLRSCCLNSDKDFVTENIPKEKMSLAKSYSAHVTFVNQCESNKSNENYLFTTGITDECIIKWRFLQENPLWELDTREYQQNLGDPFSEVISREKFVNQLNEVLPLRSECAEARQTIVTINQPDYELELRNVIGRKAYNRLNNLLYDYDENVIYLAGCNLVIAKLPVLDDDEEDFDEEDEEDGYNNQEDQKDNQSDGQQSDDGQGGGKKKSRGKKGGQDKQSSSQQPQHYWLPKRYLKQDLIKLDQSKNSSDPEISCFSLSADKKLLIAGTCSQLAKLIVWDICSRTCTKNMILQNSSMVLLVKFAYDARHVACLSITNEYTLMVFLIDIHYTQILGCCNFPYSSPFKIKDLEFLPDSTTQFVTCGVQHMQLWSFKGTILSYSSFEMQQTSEMDEQKKARMMNAQNLGGGGGIGGNVGGEDDNNPYSDVMSSQNVGNKQTHQGGVGDQDLMMDKDEDAKDDDDDAGGNAGRGNKIIESSFLRVIFVFDVAISASEDGYLYFWEGTTLKKKHLAHPLQNNKCIIMSLDVLKDSNIFVSGGIDGRIIIWSLEPGQYYFNIIKLQEYVLHDLSFSDAIKMPEYYVQSLCIGSNYILVGTKSGDIYQLKRIFGQQAIQQQDDQANQKGSKAAQQLINKNQQQQQQTIQQQQQLRKLSLSCSDHEIPRDMAFSSDSKQLYSITQKGLFCVWRVSTLQKQYSKHFQKDTHSMIVCKLNQIILIAFDTEIVVLSSKAEENYQCKLTYQMHQTISDIKVDKSEQQLAVALGEYKDNKVKIGIYRFEKGMPNFIKSAFEIKDMSTNIEYLDFSTDEKFLMYKDNFEEISFIDIKNVKKTNQIFIEHDIEWCSDGIMISDKTKGVHDFYNDENKILRMTLIGDEKEKQCLAATDEMGTIRIFSYNANTDNNGYMRCYTDHLNYINQCVSSPDHRYLATCSEVDRCIFIWVVHKNERVEEPQTEVIKN